MDNWREASRRQANRRHPEGSQPSSSRQFSDQEWGHLAFIKWMQQEHDKFTGGQDDGHEEYPEYSPQM